MTTTALFWFRRDLRLADNPALAAAAERAGQVVPVFILDDDGDGAWKAGGATRWWLHHSLASLDAALRRVGSRLTLRRGPAAAVIADLIRETGATALYWNRRYDRDSRAADTAIKSDLRARSVDVQSFNGSLLFEPWTVASRSGGSFKVFTPFHKACLAMTSPGTPLAAPDRLRVPPTWPASDALADWRLLPDTPDWAGGLRAAWRPGEPAALQTLARFLDERLAGYVTARDRPDLDGTSRLSPFLAAGNIGPRQIWHAARLAAGRAGATAGRAAEKFLAELVWREFAYHLLYHHEALPEANLRPAFDAFPWQDDRDALRAWQRGRTGVPIVDAGMRQLWQTGWMHNRVRMIVGSFLVKNLLQHWRHGEDWFWDTLVDADLASNAFNWQWIAGSGADAAPYFRIFNPVLQGERFDPTGAYVRTYVPELAALPDGVLHKPWTADAATLSRAGIALGDSYPAPIVDLAASRARALAAFATIRRAAD
ncbi:MAG: deoxyribodipyrimidine photo-lyase [Alphaproteobacteria bacterium]|nr:deoxyribodipyrimidine photo-lyase [Alphaproteobacteria bacterium]